MAAALSLQPAFEIGTAIRGGGGGLFTLYESKRNLNSERRILRLCDLCDLCTYLAPALLQQDIKKNFDTVWLGHWKTTD
jgi:hypothetical protein